MPFPFQGRQCAVWTSLALATWTAGVLPAQAQNTAGVSALDEVVVTASGFEQLIEEAPASISIIKGDDLRKRATRDLSDALRDVEGVTVSGTANESDISIRGLPGEYTLILVDGKRQSTRDARVNGNRGYEQSFIPPAEAIERIEVVRGPMSSLYGSDAMGGVVNIITKKVANKWGGSVSLDSTLQTHSDSGNSWQGQFYLNGPIKEDVVGLQMWGRQMVREADDESILGGFSKARHRDLTARLLITPSQFQDILLEAGATRLENGSEYTSVAATTLQQNNRDHWSITHNGRWGWATSKVSLAREKAWRIGFQPPREPQIENTVLDATLTAPLGDHMLSTGLQWNDASLTDFNPGLKDNRNYQFGVVQKAVFVEDEWALTERFSLTGGLRLDDHEHYGRHFNPRLYGVWRATDNWTVKGGISRGFKAPELRAIVPGYAYLRGRDRFVMLGNPDLKPETSTTTEIGTTWSNRSNLTASATLFRTNFKDKLSTLTTTNRWVENPSIIVMDRINIDRAVITGAEFSTTWNVSRTVDLKANYTYTDSEQRSGTYQGFALARTPKHMFNLRGEWRATGQTTLWSALSFRGKEIEAGGSNGREIAPGVREYPSYVTADLGASFAATKDLTLNAAIYNVGDKRLDEAEYNTVNYGRRVWLSANLRF